MSDKLPLSPDTTKPVIGSKTGDQWAADRIRRKADFLEERAAAVDGAKVADKLLELAGSLETPKAGEDSQVVADKWKMFSEIVTRCAYDVAGNVNATSASGKKYNGFDEIFQHFAKSADTKTESAYRKVLTHLPLYKKGMVQTPHPTEMLDRSAIAAEIALHHTIEECSDLFTKYAKTGGSVSHEETGKLREHLEKLFTEIKPVTQPLKIENEINRSIEFSELAFDAVPHMMQAVLDPAIRNGARNTTPLTFDELHHFSRLIEPATWSPGDRDSKPDMTVERLDYGIEQNRNLMSLQYAAKIADTLDKLGTPITSDTPGKKKVYKELEDVFSRILASIPESFLPHDTSPKDANDKTLGDKFIDHLLKNNPKKVSIGDKIRIAAKYHADAMPFESTAEMIKALENIRERGRLKGDDHYAFSEKLKFNGDHPVLNDLDVLITQMHCFGKSALRSQIRENAEMHEAVMSEIAKIPEVAAIAGAFTDRKAYAEKILDILGDPQKQEQGDALRKVIQDKLSELTPAKGTRGSDVYETLAGMSLANKNPEAIPQYLIAECRSGTDILEAFALLKLVEPKDSKKSGHAVEIVPLVEHREHVGSIGNMMIEAYQNPHFMAHQTEISSNSAGILRESTKGPSEVSLENRKSLAGHFDRMTVAEIKKAYGLEIKEGDAQKEISHTKMVMFAGSDIMKSAGPTGAAMTQHAIAELREQMLDMTDKDGKANPVLLVDYTGSGGGIHRSQPVSTSFETTQGRSMRQTPTNIAHKGVTTMARFIKRMMGLEGKAQLLDKDTGQKIFVDDDGILTQEKSKLGKLAQLNLSNMVGFPTNDSAWKTDTGARNEAAMDSYQEMYKSPEFAAMMAFSADKFVKLTSYAARPLQRVSGKGESNDYPPIVDVEKLRAIGYGAALNVSGSSASLYFGVSKFLHADEILGGKEEIKKLAELYLKDTRTQDVVNRATFGIVSADLNAAWTYLGKERKVDGQNNVTVSDNGGANAESIQELASRNNTAALKLIEDFKSATQHVGGDKRRKAEMEFLGKLSLEDKRTLAIHAMAKVDEEYQKVSKVLLKLHSAVIGEMRQPEAKVEIIHDQILDRLPAVLSSQIRESRDHIGSARTTLAKEFLDSWQKEGHPLRGKVEDIRQDPKTFDSIYYRMGACNEYFENAPRALTRPWWAHRKEMDQMQSQQASVATH